MQGAAHVLRVVERSDCALCGLGGGKVCAVRKDHINGDGVHVWVKLVLYESNPPFVSRTELRLWRRDIVALAGAPFHGALDAVCAWRRCGGCRPLECDRTEAH